MYARHLPAISGYLHRRVEFDDVEDLAADVFAVAWRRRDQVRAGEEAPWLFRIAAHLVANHRRRLAVRRSLLGLLAAPDSAPSAESLALRDAELGEAWSTLRPREREVLSLVVIDDLAVADAARALGISPNAASIRLHRAKRSLAAALKPERKIEATDDISQV